MRFYRATALVFAASFALVGLIFLVAPGLAWSALEWAARAAGMQGVPAGGVESGLFQALAVAYMYVVTLLAWMTFRRPAEPIWPTLLAQAKLASAAISILLFAVHGPYLVYAANGLIDGAIGAAALFLRHRAIGRRPAFPAGGAGA